MLWDLNEGKHLYTLDSGDTINALCFSPNRYWLCAATGPSIKIWVKDFILNKSWSLKDALKLQCKGRWWNFQCQLYYMMIKRLFLSSSLDKCISNEFMLHQLLIDLSLVFFSLCRILRARSLWMSWDRKWSAQTARLNHHSALPWHGLLMDRYVPQNFFSTISVAIGV